MSKQLVIGFSSAKEGGKDMAQGIMERVFYDAGIRTTSIRFADPLKDLVATLFGWDRERMDTDHEYKETVDPFWGISPRVALQKVGTELFREGVLFTEFKISMWVDKFYLSCSKFMEECQRLGENRIIFCPDVRFNDEFVAIKGGLKGTLIFCDPRPRIVPAENAHGSEVDMWEYGDWDHVLDYGHAMQKSIDETEELAHTLVEAFTGV